MIEIQVFAMENDEQGAKLAESGNPNFYDILVRDIEDPDGDGTIEEIENIATWDEVALIVEKLEAKYGVSAECLYCP